MKIQKYIFLFIWAAVSVVVLVSLGAHHYFAFLPFIPAESNNVRWKITHVLAADCECSKTVSQYLLNRGPSSDIDEEIIWISSEKNNVYNSLAEKKFKIRTLTDIDKKAAAGVPTLVISAPRLGVVYAGGYSERKIASVDQIRDLEILASLQGKKAVQRFPIFGCAISSKYQNLLDPFHIKYSKRGEP